MTPAVVTAGLELALLGWPVFPIKPREKVPITRHGVKDATTDPAKIKRWFRRYPDANIAVATGAPGPDVLDIDQPDQAGPTLDRARRAHAPTVATTRGSHFYFAGTSNGTVSLAYGELRAQGSYVLVPPSVHPSGKLYIWLEAPNGPLPILPDGIIGTRQTAGTGELHAPDLIPHGNRHDALKDMAVRFLRAGITDIPTLEGMLADFFARRCDPDPPPRTGEFRKIARWASNSEIAQREREAAQAEPLLPKKTRKKTKLNRPPSGDAPLAEHRAYVRLAGGWSDRIDIKHVRRYGTQGPDALEIRLSNGQRITFSRQDHVTTRGHWVKTVISCTNGIADPIALSDWEAGKVFRSLCILADAPLEEHEAEQVQDAVDDLVALTEPFDGIDLSSTEGRYTATARCHARGSWDHRDPEKPPVLLIDTDGKRYLRAGEVRDYLSHRGLGISATALTGRLQMIGIRPITISGREAARPDRETRRTNHMRLYELPEEPS